MEGVTRQLSAVVADAISQQIGVSDTDAEGDLRVQQQTARDLVRAAIAGGHVGEVHIADLQKFSSGATAMLVARVNTTLSFVVKVDRTPHLISEAYLLRRAASDPCLPEATRRCFPTVYAIDDVGPIYGYLMENLEGYKPLWQAPGPEDGITHEDLLSQLWRTVLEPAYRATRSKRLAPNVVEDYFVRAADRLTKAAADGLLPGPTTALRIDTGHVAIDVPDGWGPAIETASKQLVEMTPPYSTFVHGDPNPENVLWKRDDSGAVSFRLIDPKDWWTGDYIFDIAKLIHYFQVTLPVETGGIHAEIRVGSTQAIVSYDPSGLMGECPGQSKIYSLVGGFARDSSCPDPDWEQRLSLAIGANLLAIVGPRLARAASSDRPTDRCIALIALGEGLKALCNTG